MNQEEMSAICAQTLLPKHATDPKILEFIGNYLACRSIPQAARASGLSNADGNHLFNRPDIYKCIRELTQKAVVKFGFDAEEVVERVKEIGFFDPVQLTRPDGTWIKNINDIPAEARRVIKKLKVKNIYEEDGNGIPQYKGEVIEFEFHDKLKGLELLAREKDTFKKTTVVEHDVSKNMRNILLDSLKRSEERMVGGSEVLAIDVTPSGPPPIPTRFKS